MIFYDTSALLDLKEQAFDENSPFVIASTTLRELENIKTSAVKSDDIKYAARKVTRLLTDKPDLYDVVIVDEHMINTVHTTLGYWCETNDDKIMASAWYFKEYTLHGEAELTFVTNDLCCENLAKFIFGLDVSRTQGSHANNTIYKGWTEIQLEDGGEEALAAFYQDPETAGANLAGTPLNGYLIIKGPDGETVGLMRWDGNRYVPIKYKNLNTQFSGKIKPLNDQQKLAFDMLQNEDITVKMLAGTFGSGKTMLMVASAVDLIEKGEYDKIVWIRNNVEVKNTKPLGFLPGTLEEKVFGAIAGPLSDHLGGDHGLEYWINSGKIELTHLGLIRGRDIRKSIILVNEAENLTKEHMQLLLGRVGVDSMLWIDGDLKQTDDVIFEQNSGMKKMVECLAGNPHFAYVYMPKTERSETARLADLLDD